MTQFRLLDTAAAQAAPGVFGVWETAPGEMVSFAAPEAGEEIPVWSVDLPADPGLAAVQLDAGLAQIEDAGRALGTASARLEALTRPDGEVSFDVASGTPLPPAEQELLGALAGLRAGQQAAVSFGLLPGGADLIEAEEKFKNVLTRLAQSLAYFAFVETRVDSRLLCRTRLSWSSDSQTLWQSGLRAEQWELHRRTLALSVESRAALMRTVALSMQSAVKIAALLAMPGGAVLALPSAWKFINQVLAEAGQQRAALHSAERS